MHGRAGTSRDSRSRSVGIINYVRYVDPVARDSRQSSVAEKALQRLRNIRTTMRACTPPPAPRIVLPFRGEFIGDITARSARGSHDFRRSFEQAIDEARGR